MFLKSSNFNKIKNGTFNIVGCTPFELKEHIEKQFLEGMTWENYGFRLIILYHLLLLIVMMMSTNYVIILIFNLCGQMIIIKKEIELYNNFSIYYINRYFIFFI